jgi:two-component system, OmpR family, sensor kinase
MILKSIKWRLQLWYGLILVAVLVGFGVTAYQLEHSRVFRRIDDESRRCVDMLVRTLHGGPRPGPGGRRGDFRPGQPPGPPDGFPGEGMPGHDLNAPRQFNLPPEAAGLFGTNSPNGFYFVVMGRDGNEIASSANVPNDPDVAISELMRMSQHGGTDSGPRQMPPWNADGHRYNLQFLPSGETILIGCSIAPEMRELEVIALELSGFGGGILVLGLAGGWWFVRRALRPISDISATAARISAGDLSQRINSGEAESELGQLAAVLNSTFARLEAAFAQQQQFASDAAHELRTPVTVILTQTQMALGRERDAASYKQTVEACQRAAQRMRKLIESLLELARFDAGQEVLKRLKFDLSKNIAECVELVQPLAEERHVKTATELDSLEMTGDSERLGQVVTNLLTNAIQYNKPDGEVQVKLAGQGGLAVLEIADTGRGITPADMPHIFERFYRADKSRTGNGNSGLGLSICKAIIEAHGGTIEASSVENEGTKFVVRLPMGG